MISFARQNGGLVRKNPIDSIHPLVRVHPVTGERALFLNAEFVTGMPGLKDKEYELLRDFLIGHVERGHDFQCRVQWQRGSVVMFDGRNTLRECHSSVESGEKPTANVRGKQTRRQSTTTAGSKQDIFSGWRA